MVSKNNSQGIKNTRKYTKIADYVSDENDNISIMNNVRSSNYNASTDSRDTADQTSNYVSGDSARSSSSHQFHRDFAD